MTVDTARLRGLLARPDKIRADMKAFDGDKRGYYGALEEACDELFRETIKTLPALLDAIEAAEAEVVRLTELLRLQTGDQPTLRVKAGAPMTDAPEGN